MFLLMTGEIPSNVIYASTSYSLSEQAAWRFLKRNERFLKKNGSDAFFVEHMGNEFPDFLRVFCGMNISDIPNCQDMAGVVKGIHHGWKYILHVRYESGTYVFMKYKNDGVQNSAVA